MQHLYSIPAHTRMEIDHEIRQYFNENPESELTMADIHRLFCHWEIPAADLSAIVHSLVRVGEIDQKRHYYGNWQSETVYLLPR